MFQNRCRHDYEIFGIGGVATIILRPPRAQNIISEPHWGSVLKALDHQEADKQLEQKVAVRMSTVIKGTCTANGFDEVLDDEVLPALICAISKKARPYFQQSLLKAMPGAVLHDEGREHWDSGVGVSIQTLEFCANLTSIMVFFVSFCSIFFMTVIARRKAMEIFRIRSSCSIP